MDSKDQPDEAEVLRPKKQQQADAVKVDQESLTGDMSVMFQRPAAAPEVDPVRARLGQLPSSNSPEPQLSASVVAELEQRHAEHVGDLGDQSFLFPAPKSVHVKPQTNMIEEGGMLAKPGKQWRRSISVAKSVLEAKKTLFQTSENLCVHDEDQEIIESTPQKPSMFKKPSNFNASIIRGFTSTIKPRSRFSVVPNQLVVTPTRASIAFSSNFSRLSCLPLKPVIQSRESVASSFPHKFKAAKESFNDGNNCVSNIALETGVDGGNANAGRGAGHDDQPGSTPKATSVSFLGENSKKLHIEEIKSVKINSVGNGVDGGILNAGSGAGFDNQPGSTTTALDFSDILSTLQLNTESSQGTDSFLENEIQPHRTIEKPLGHLLGICSKATVMSFRDIFPDEMIKTSRKVGEGAFGEVFLISGDKNPVLKVVPFDGNLPVNGEDQTSTEDIISEVCITSALSDLRKTSRNQCAGFVELRSVHVFRGRYPQLLLELWDQYNEEKESENDRPDGLPVDQLYIALEFNNGGRDLEKFIFKNPCQALQAWLQVVHSLAVAEVGLRLEHRDLHWGNVLITETEAKTVEFTISGDTYQVETGGVETTIIDFSLSRLEVDGGNTIFKDLANDHDLFTARGMDHGGDYQFDIYRKMRSIHQEDWAQFKPKTNIFWLHYMVEKCIDGVYYKKSLKKTSKIYKSGMGKLRTVRNQLLDFDSAEHYVRREGIRI